MGTKFNLKIGSAVKKTITISRRELWNNYVSSWKDIVFEQFEDTLYGVNEVAEALCNVSVSAFKVKKLFKDGWTVMLLGDAMEHFDCPDRKDILMEVNVVEGDLTIVVPHEWINY